MAATIKNKNDSILDNVVENRTVVAKIAEPSPVDSQVKIKRHYTPRRPFDIAYKLRILSAYDACEDASERGALLRKEGLYQSRISAWKQQLANAKLSGRKKQSNTTLRTDHLARENEQLRKKLAQAEAVIEIQKKISELLGTYILPHRDSESKS